MAVEHEDAELSIRARVVRDDKFREALLRDPVVTLEREYGVKVPEGLTIQVHEETDDVIHLVVPGRLRDFASLPDDVLDDTIMEMMRDKRTSCCTCGSSTSQSMESVQTGCGC